MIITENSLDHWARTQARLAQSGIVELTYRLVRASTPHPKEIHFPLGDSIEQPGTDGFLDTDFDFKPYVPEGKSFWEIGTSLQPAIKATEDYRNLTTHTPEIVRRNSTFVFVTPLSGRRSWKYTWKKDGQKQWLAKRLKKREWRDVRLIDGTALIEWLRCWPAVERWLADTMGLPVQQMHTLEQHWDELKTIGAPPPLTPDVFLANREIACEKLKEVFSRTSLQLKVDTHFPTQLPDFIAAYVASMDDQTKQDVTGRSLIVSGIDAWNAITSLHDQHVLIADFDLDDDDVAAKLLEKAHRASHAVIFAGMPGGLPHPNRVAMPNPKSYQIKDALEKGGYKEERARVLAQKSGGNLSSLLRCLQSLSLMPEWAQGTDAAELAIAELLGAWKEESQSDRATAEKLSKKAYGEWIKTMRDVELRPGTPLNHRDGTWKMVARYEGWYVLGPRLFDEHLDRLKEISINILRERDPQFELTADQRFAASIHGKVLAYSRVLRKGIVESLALLGSHPKALTSCSFGKAETTAAQVVRETLVGDDWVLWASLNELLPLLAEAAPEEFLDAAENALNTNPCPFDALFTQESSGIMGGNYMTGLLWGLETLAWEAKYLTRVVMILGELAAKDPGGRSSNRPAEALSTILTPWLPQTCAPVPKRQATVATLLNELPDVGWKILLNLLPRSREMSSGSRKPAWREIIPDDWSSRVTQEEYWEQTTAYAELAIGAAKQDLSKLVELIDRLDDLPPAARDQLLAHLRSHSVVSMSQIDRLRLWTPLSNLVARHKKYADARWAMKPEVVNEIAAAAASLEPDAPTYRHRRLFSERDLDLYEEKGNYDEQQKELDNRREKAINEVILAGGSRSVVEFANNVESPWRVAFALAAIPDNSVQKEILPELLGSTTKSMAQFAGGYIWGMFRRRGWTWVDDLKMDEWTPPQRGQLLAYLPFNVDTWKRVAQVLKEDESPYWSKTNANPYQAEEGLEHAVDRLLQYGRPHDAIRCLERIRGEKQPLNSQQAVRALQAVLQSSESVRALDIHAIVEVITALQDDPNADRDDLLRIEWAFLPLLEEHHSAAPKALERKLAEDPAFFCEVIRKVFRSKKKTRVVEEPGKQESNAARNAYRLLSEWKLPPGSREDGAFDGDALVAWLKDVKRICVESGHLEVALTVVGQVLIHTPPDPDGLWLHKSAATVLNAKDASDMREGFTIAIANSRGVHMWTAGQEERELAKKYRAQAEEIEGHGYHRLASALKELAASYERDAERNASRDPFDE